MQQDLNCVYEHQGSLYSSFQNDFLKSGHKGDEEIIKFDLQNVNMDQKGLANKKVGIGNEMNSNDKISKQDDNLSDNLIISHHEQKCLDPKTTRPNNSLRDFDSKSSTMQKQGRSDIFLPHLIYNSSCNKDSVMSDSEHPQMKKSDILSSQKRFMTDNYRKVSLYFQSEQAILQQSDKDTSRHAQRMILMPGEPDSFVSINYNPVTSPINNNINLHSNLLNKSNGSPFQNSFAKKEKITKFFSGKVTTMFGEELGQQQAKFQKAIRIIQQIQNNQMNRVNRISQIVRRFLSLLMIQSAQNFLMHLQKNQFDYVNDLSGFYQLKESRKVFHKMNSYLSDLFLSCPINIPLFMPTQMFHIVWDIGLVLFTVPILMLFSMVTFCAQNETDTFFFQYLLLISFVIFSLDIVFNFNIAHFNKDLIILDRKLIAKKYLQSYFIPDFTVVIVLFLKIFLLNQPLFYNPHHNLTQYIVNILIFLKVISIPQKLTKFEEIMQTRETQKHKLKLLKLITSIILIAHTTGIGWHIVVIIENSYGIEQTWISKLNIQNEAWLTKYIYSFYWCITTMTTVGFGDITPANEYECFFMSITMIIMSCIFAYTISNIGMILQEIEKKDRELTNNISNIQRLLSQYLYYVIQQSPFINQITRYLNRKNVNISLKSRVRNYLVFLSEEQKDRNKEAEDQVFNKLSNKLREEITHEVNGKIVNNNSIFAKNFSVSTLNKIIYAMKECLVSPNEILFNEGQIDDCSIYFIQSGFIEIFYSMETDKNKNTNQICSKRLGTNQVFGELSFFSGQPRKAGAKSVNLATLYKLTHEDFLKILSENKEDFERFKMIQEQLLFQQDFQAINTECYSCNRLGHIAKKCPIIHNERNKQFIALKSNFSIPQCRIINPQKQIRIRFHARLLLEINKIIYQKLKEQSQFMSSSIRLLFTKNELDGNSSHSSEDSCSNEDYYNSQEEQQIENQNQQNNMGIPHAQTIRMLISGKKSEEIGQKKSQNSLMNIPYQENNYNQLSFIDETNEMIVLKEDLLNLYNTGKKISSANNISESRIQQQQQQQLTINNKVLNKQTSLNDKTKQYDNIIKLESQIAEVDEEPSNQSLENERYSQQSNRKANQSEKRHQIKKGSRESIPFFKGESDLLLNSILSQENPILLPQVLNIRALQGRNSIHEQYQPKLNLEDQRAMARKKGKRFATQPPVNYKYDQAIQLHLNDNKQFDVKTRRISHLFKDLSQIQTNQTQQAGINEKQKRRQSILQKNSRSNLFGSDLKKLSNLNNNLNQMKDEDQNVLEQNLSNNLIQTLSHNLINQNISNNQVLSQFELNKLQLLNQIRQMSHYENLDINDHQESQFFSKYYNKENFDEMKIFKKFFPSNNYDKVISNIKQIQQNQKKQKKQKNTIILKSKKVKQMQINNSSQNFTQKKQQFDEESNNKIPYSQNEDYIKHTYLSYGISVQNFKFYPINQLKIIN